MKHPQKAPAKRVVATVPALCDGINVGTAPFLIGDRECAEAENMWWESGALRCREGFSTTLSRFGWGYADQNTQYFTDSDGYILALNYGDYESGADVYIDVYDQNGNVTAKTWLKNGSRGLRGCLVPSGGEWLLTYTALLFLSDGNVVGINAAKNRFEEITDQIYIPQRMINGTPVTSRTQTTLTGDLLEGYNLLTTAFKSTYTTDGSGIYYFLPTVNARSTLSVTVRLDGVDKTWSLSTSGTVSEEVDDVYLYFNRQSSCFWFVKNAAPYALKASEQRGNLTAVADHGDKQDGLPFEMRFGTWFGGTVGGTRLFLGGDDSGCVVWSDLNNPLYFPSSNYATVGTPGKRATAFGKQGELLIVFKEHEIYAASYQTTTFSEQDVQAGTVTDITATAQFSFTAVHAEIGCDLPKTVVLCGNRLWWACRDGFVYALQSTGSFSQRNVVCLSAPIAPLLQQNGAPTFAAGAVKGERYYLLWGDNVFVATDGQSPTWYRFSTAQTAAQPVTVFLKDGVLYFPAAYAVGSSPSVAMFTLQGTTDTRLTHTGTHSGNAKVSLLNVPVCGTVCTKQYDFGTPEKRKTVTRVFAETTANGAVGISYITEHGEVVDLPHPSRAVEGLFATPHGLRCRRMGVKFRGEQLVVNSITVRLKE